MDALKRAAQAYQELIGKEYHITFSNGKAVRIIFKPSNFPHLAGLHKLRDLYQISSGQYGAVALYKLARSGRLTLDDLKCSCYFDSQARERLESLCRICELLVVEGKAVQGFDKKKCRAQVTFKADTLFFKDDGWEFFITFGAAPDRDGEFHYPETVFYRFDRAYIIGQNVVTITNVSVKTVRLGAK